MNFRTELNILPSKQKLSHNDGIFLIGSCFSQNIGEYLKSYKFDVHINPFGNIYNPVSIANVIEMTCALDRVNENDMWESHGVFVHPSFHSTLGRLDIDEAIRAINSTIEQTHLLLQSARTIIITLGTSLAYRYKSTMQLVANCHKVPAAMFDPVVIDIDHGTDVLGLALGVLRRLNPSINIVLTISPVRHIKDGIIQNARSKAGLIGMVDQLQKSEQSITYFPSYEWMMDDLRDYRYYEDDMIHPNGQAIAYIWAKFKDHYFDAETKILLDKIDQINKACRHKPFNPNSKEHKKFCQVTIRQINQLVSLYPELDFSAELDLLSTQQDD
ncbi:MAG: GSCFA domain-containing protein [Saprospiraceae bacterium]